MAFTHNKSSATYQKRQEGLHKLRYILQQVEAKKLEHKQSSWHCGTSHCIFGWIEVFELSDKISLRKLKQFDFSEGMDYDDEIGASILVVGKTKLQLAEDIVEDWRKRYHIPNTYDTRTLLSRIYNGEATFAEQFDALEDLELLFLGSVQKVTKNPFVKGKTSKPTELTREQINFQTMLEGLKSSCEVPVCETEQVIETVQEARV